MTVRVVINISREKCSSEQGIESWTSSMYITPSRVKYLDSLKFLTWTAFQKPDFFGSASLMPSYVYVENYLLLLFMLGFYTWYISQ